LQNAYNNGNTITTTDNRDLSFTLADTATDSNFTVTTANGSTGSSVFALGAGSSTNVPNQLILVDNKDDNNTLTSGIAVTSSGGGAITNGIDLSDAAIVNALSLGANDITSSHFTLTGANGNISTDGTLAVNGTSLTTTSSNFSLVNSGATTLNIGGTATTLNLGATSGTATINNATISFPHATSITANGATLNVDTAAIGGGYTVSGSGASIDTNGNISANGTLTVDGASTLTGAVTASSGITISGATSADLISSKTTANLFNTTATTLNIGGAATTVSLGAAGGTTTVNGALSVASGKTFTANGQVNLSPSGTNGVTFTGDTDSFFTLTGIPTNSGTTALCLDGSNHLTTCSASTNTLQTAYNGGNTITTADNKDIAFTLADTTTDSNFTVTTANGSTGSSVFSLGAGASATVPNQLILVDNKNASNTLAAGIAVTSSGGGAITNGLDLSDAAIVNALSLGANDITSSHFTLTGASGNIATDGTVAVNGNALTTTNSSFSLVNSGATTLNFGGAATTLNIGATSGTATINNATISFPHATSITANGATLNVDTAAIGGGYTVSGTGASIDTNGNGSFNGTLAVDGNSTLGVNSSTTTTVAGTLAANGGTIATNQTTANLLNSTATTINFGGGATGTINVGNASGTTLVKGALTVDTGKTFTANGQINLSPNSTNGVTFTGDTDSFLTLTGLPTNTGTALCVDASNHASLCSASSQSLQSAYNNGNTITTTTGKNIAFTLASGLASPTSVTLTNNGTADAFAITQGLTSGTSTNGIKVDINGTGGTTTNGIQVSQTAGTLTNGITISGTVANAINLSGTNFTNLINSTNFTVANSGDVTTAGNIAVNGGALTTSQSSATVFNSNATTLNIGGAATTLNLGANSGTATINNGTLSLPNATQINATGATANLDVVKAGGGYTVSGSGATIDTNGNASFNGTLTVDGASTLTGAVTASAGVKVNGATTADITTDKTTANVFNATATTLNIGGAATTVSLGAAGGTTTVNGGLTVANGQTLTANGTVTLGDGGDALTTSSTTLGVTTTSTQTFNIANNLANAFDIKQGTNDYLNITTTTGSPTMTFGNASTNPAFTFAGSGTVTVSGNTLAINGTTPAITTSSTGTANVFNTNATTLNVGGAATAIAIGASSGTTTIGNSLTVNGASTILKSTSIDLQGNNTTLDMSGTGTLSLNTTNNRAITLGTGTLTVGTNTTNFSGSAPVIAASTTNAALSINSNGSGDLNLQSNSQTGNVNIAGTSASSGCTVTNSNGNIACAGSFTTTASSGNVQFGYFSRDFNTGIISNSTAGDTLALSTTSTSNPILSLTTSGLTTSNIAAFTNNVTVSGNTSSATYYGQKLLLTNNQTTNPDTVYGQYISFADAGSLANTAYGLYIDASTANASDKTYAAAFMNGNVGIGTSTPTEALTLASGSNFGTYLAIPGTPVFGTVSASGGSFANGTYYFKVAAFDSQGNLTAASSENNVTVSNGPAASIPVSWTAVSGAAGYRVYQGTSAGNENVYYTVYGNSFTATNTGTTAGAAPSTNNAFANKFNFDGTGSLQTSLKIGSLPNAPTSTLAALDVRNTSGTLPSASISGKTSFAGLVVDNAGKGDLFAASSSGLNRFVIAQNGNVGIGTTLPSEQLAISSPDNNATGIKFINTSGNYDQWTAGVYGVNNGGGSFAFHDDTAGFTRMLIDPNGNVGIGDTSPAAAFVVGSGDLFQVSSAGNVNFNLSAPTISFNGGGTLHFTDGANDLLTLTDTSASQTDLKLGKASAQNGILTLFSSGTTAGNAPTLAADGSGNVTLKAPAGTTFIGSGAGNILIQPPTGNVVNVNLVGSGTNFNVQNSGANLFQVFGSTGNTLWTVPAGANIKLDAASNPNTLTTGALELDVTSNTANNVGFQNTYTMSATSGTQYAQNITLALTNSGGTLDGLQIKNNSSSSVGANQIGCLLCLTNSSGVANAVTSAIKVTGSATNNDITTGLDFSGATTMTTDIKLQNGETIDNDTNGTVNIKDSSGTTLISTSTTTTQINLSAQITSGNQRVCHNGVNGATGLQTIGDCSGTQGDYAEEYGTSDSTMEAGDVVTTDATRSAETITKDGVEGSKAWIVKSDQSYQSTVLGVVSTSPNEIIGENFDPSENPHPVALNGRVPVKVTNENGPIEPGDYLTTSSTPGYAMKATKAGSTLGKALEEFTGTTGKIYAFINISYTDPNDILNKLTLDANGNIASNSIDLSAPVVIDGQVVSGTIDDMFTAISNKLASQSAQINQLNQIVSQLGTPSADTTGLDQRVATLEAQMTQTNNQVLSFSDQIASISANISLGMQVVNDKIASQEAALQQLADLTAQLSSYNASSAAQLGLDQLTVNTATISGTLNVLGRTTLNDLGVTGNITAGVMTINGLDTNGQASINTVGDLKLQDQGLGGIDIMAGKVKIDTDGNVNILNTLTAKVVNTQKLNITTTDDAASSSAVLSASLGTITIPAGDTQAIATTSALTSKSSIFATPQDTPVAISTEKTAANTFLIKIAAPQDEDLKVNWWIVN
jgi:hypothetical protein